TFQLSDERIVVEVRRYGQGMPPVCCRREHKLLSVISAQDQWLMMQKLYNTSEFLSIACATPIMTIMGHMA
ncbi:hypothetical protein ACFOYU_13835, partial [Microvirga sp. GCM10011540]|uniref:hypothetical protein n=1 Tax=Microvirga sp. GCM10011540 TaxID=3317338 RepID=UPI00361BD653